MAKYKVLSPARLKRIVLEEKTKLDRRKLRALTNEVLETGESESEKVAAKAPEVDADELADTLEQDVDWMKALKIHERRLRNKLSRVNEAKKKIRKRIIRRIK